MYLFLIILLINLVAFCCCSDNTRSLLVWFPNFLSFLSIFFSNDLLTATHDFRQRAAVEGQTEIPAIFYSRSGAELGDIKLKYCLSDGDSLGGLPSFAWLHGLKQGVLLFSRSLNRFFEIQF